jgi:NADPH:quinone reductase-like Zn-dependent oxidoreductase
MGGADYAIDYTKVGWQKEVLKVTGGRGVDVVYDPVGRIKGTISTSLFFSCALNGGLTSVDLNATFSVSRITRRTQMRRVGRSSACRWIRWWRD